MTVYERFWTKVDKTDGCWLWTGNRTQVGYGRFFAQAQTFRAHRFAYEMLVGPIPKGLTLDHLCRVRLCVNPAHLEPVTSVENVLRGVSRSAENARKTHCSKGHPFDEINTYRWKDGTRHCRLCHTIRARESYRANPEPERARRLARYHRMKAGVL